MPRALGVTLGGPAIHRPLWVTDSSLGKGTGEQWQRGTQDSRCLQPTRLKNAWRPFLGTPGGCAGLIYGF